MKIDNEKLVEIVKDRDSEIARLIKILKHKEHLSERSNSVDGAACPSARIQPNGKDQSDLKLYYET